MPAPLPPRFVEFSSFALTVIGTWAASSAVVGGYSSSATPRLTSATRRATPGSKPGSRHGRRAAGQNVLESSLEGGAPLGRLGLLDDSVDGLGGLAGGLGACLTDEVEVSVVWVILQTQQSLLEIHAQVLVPVS